MQRSDQREREADIPDVALGESADPDATAGADADTDSGGRSGLGLRRRIGVGGLFSPKAFLFALVLSLVGLFLGGAIPIVGFVGRFVGLFVAAFVVGLVGSRRRYTEVGLAGGLAAGLGFVLSTLTSVFAPFAVRLLAEYGLAIAGVGVGAGLLASLAGYYFGRDLRDGLTRDLG